MRAYRGSGERSKFGAQRQAASGLILRFQGFWSFDGIPFVRDNFRKILGVRFYISDLEGLLGSCPRGRPDRRAPSAPVMVRLADDPAHREAMEGADFAITDSGFMVVLWLLRTGERIRRISGLRLLRGLVAGKDFRGRGDTFWVMPSAADSDANLAWLRSRGFDVTGDDAYVAPMYPRQGPMSDRCLVDLINARRPKLVVDCFQRRGPGEARLGAAQAARLQAGDPVHRRGHRLPLGPAGPRSRCGPTAWRLAG